MTRQRTINALAAFTLTAGAATASAQVVINEVDYDQPSTDTAEFLELKNTGSAAVDLGTFQVQMVNGANDTQYRLFDLPSVSLPPGGYFVLCGNAANVANCDLDVSPDSNLIQNGAPDALALLDGGVIVDSVSYEGDVPGFVEGAGGAGTDSPSGVQGLSRCSDGVDTDDNAADFALRPSTPGVSNDCPAPPPMLGQCGDPATLISAVQGSGSASPMVGQFAVVEAVVVGDFQDAQINGVFLQEEDGDADADPFTSEGLFVFNLPIDVAEGEVVRVLGTVAEFSSLTELDSILDATSCGFTGSASETVVRLPVDAVSEFEAVEGMRVRFPQRLTVTENFNLGRFGSVSLSVRDRLFQPTQVAAPGADAAAVADLNSRSRIELDDASTIQNPNPIPYLDANQTRRIGDRVRNLTGILSGRFGTYRVQPTVAPRFRNRNRRPRKVADVGGNLKVAAFNVLNFFTTLDENGNLCGPSNIGCRGADNAVEFDRQRTKILNALEKLDADIVALNEIENNDTTAAQSLVDGLNQRVGAGTYDFVHTGTIGTDAIKVAYLYQPAKVALVGAPAILDSSVDPRFLDQKNRPALAQTFALVSNGKRITVVNNHLKSKGSPCDDVGDPNGNDGQGNCNGTRTAAAEAMADWLATDPTSGNTDNILIIGDLNAYAMEDPITALKNAGYEPLIDTFIGPKASSFVFFGENGYLDHALTSPALSRRITGVTEWHINADEPRVLDYNTEFKTQDPFNPNDEFRASDHDPLVVGIQLGRRCPRGNSRRARRCRRQYGW